MTIQTRLVALASLFFAFVVPCVASAAQPIASWALLPTGNGHGFQVYDVAAGQVTTFLERPYKYLHPGANLRAEGVLRRDLAYDIYFGVRAGTQGAWLREVPRTATEYVEQSNIIRATSTVNGVRAESHFFAPFGLEGNVMVMLLHVTNTTSAPIAVDGFALPNLHMGAAPDPENPTAAAERVVTDAQTGVATETGLGADGAAVYVPLGGYDRADCAGNAFQRVKNGQDLLGSPLSRDGDDLVLAYQKSFGTLAPGADAWWGLAIGFSPDAAARDALVAEIERWRAGRPPSALVAGALAEIEAWRKPPPDGLTDRERRIWRQSEMVLRMAQVREPYRTIPKQKGHGMILASLPPGIWHIGWVRDATYAIVALARMGHFAEAKAALQFFLDAEGNRYMSYAGVPYRISVTRYFGDGQEESDWDATTGPNIEFDGWGLFLWAARTYVDVSGDVGWLEERTKYGERNFDVIRDLVAGPLLYNIDRSNGLVVAESSIWESHWTGRKQYAYTSLTTARGLCDMTRLAAAVGDAAAGARALEAARAMPAAVQRNLVDAAGVIAGSLEEKREGTRYLNATTVEALNWGLFPVGSTVEKGTLDAMSALEVVTGGYKRNDDALSSYDENEWIVIDLRIATAMRRAGRTARADTLIAWVTAQGALNYDLVPELYNTFSSDGPIGAYAGAIPMVGFGAGAYLLALLDRAGVAKEQQDCKEPTTMGEADGGTSDGGTDMGGGGGGGGSSGCGLAPASSGSSTSALVAIIAALLCAAIVLRRSRV
jgi:hypothetical protein